MPVLQELLYPQVIFKSVTTRVKKVNDTLSRFWGWQLGGPNYERIPGAVGAYDIFDSVRRPAGGRAPMTPPATRPPNPLSQQPITCLRVHEKMPLYYSRIFPIRRMGGPATQIDPGGADYIERQKGILRTGFDNTREFLTASMMTNSGGVLISGDDWIPVFTGQTVTFGWQIPAASNTGQLTNPFTSINCIGSTWLNTTNATVFEDVLAVDAMFWAMHGWPLKHIWCNSVVWGYVTNNAGIKARSGTSNTPFTQFVGLGRTNNTDYTQDEFAAEIRCLPGIRWHVYNGGLELNAAAGSGFVKFWGDTIATFLPEPGADLATMVQGTEFVQENEMVPAMERNMPFFWAQYVREPAKIELVGLDLAMVALRVPKSIAVGTVVF